MSCVNNQTNINETFIIEPMFVTGDSTSWSACTALYTNEIDSCSGDTVITMGTGQIGINQSLVPATDISIDLGTPVQRFRAINTFSGTSTYWNFNSLTSPTINTTTINLGLDSLGNPRILTANSSVLQEDILNAGFY